MIIDKLNSFKHSKFFAIIIGSGPAGVSVALKLEEKGLDSLIIEAGSQNYSNESLNFLNGEVFGDNYSDEAEEIPFDDNVEFLKDELDRMLKLQQKYTNDEELMKSMTSYEWDMVWTYQKALATAILTAIETVEQMPPPEERDYGSSSDDDDSRDHYDSRDDSEDDESSSDDGDSTHDEL